MRGHDLQYMAARARFGSCRSESHGRIKAASYDPGRSMSSLKQIDYHRVRLGRDEPTFQAWFALHPVWLLVSTCGIGPQPWGRIIS
jgi:hypothetical protein